ncbi:MAG TPA: hypothetical protein VI193_09285 [Acidimicrobiia bacterium]
MTNEDHIVALFAKANPVPSLDLLDPVEALDIERLTHPSERSSAMTDVEAIQPKKGERQSGSRLLLGLAVAVIAFIALGIFVTKENAAATPESVANAYMEAREDLDSETAQSLFAEGATMSEEGFTLPQLPGLFSWYQASNWNWTPGECTEASTGPKGTLVRCSYEFENDWTRALGHAAVTGNLQLQVSEGEITKLTSALDTGQFGDVWEGFLTWMIENHPDDFDQMYVSGGTAPLIDPTSIALWEQHTEEFVASLEN